jgi:hypothetical protein
MSDRLTELRIENKRLKTQIANLESKILSVVGMISIENSGGPQKPSNLINDLVEIIQTTSDQLNVISPKIDRYYTIELTKAAEKGIPVLLITRDRRLMMKEYQKYYDDLKNTAGISVINNPNVRYLLVFNSNMAIYSGGSLDKDELEKSILIVTKIKETAKLRKIAEIFTLMLPSFMR